MATVYNGVRLGNLPCQCRIGVLRFQRLSVSIISSSCYEYCVLMLYLNTKLSSFPTWTERGMIGAVRWSVVSCSSTDRVGNNRSVIWIHIACHWSNLKIFFKLSHMDTNMTRSLVRTNCLLSFDTTRTAQKTTLHSQTHSCSFNATRTVEKCVSNNLSIVVCIRCHGNVSTEPLPRNDKGDTHTDTQTDETDL
jgi:hypothetical protein